MAYKRQIDRLPIIPANAKVHNVTCHYCIVGCGYHAYSWDVNTEGGTAPGDNVFGADLSKQQDAMTANWYSPSMYNIVKQDGKDVHIVIKPDPECSVNSGLGSIRGARIAEMSYSRQRNTQLQRLTDPMVWRYGQMQPTSWDDALDLVARVTAAVINEQGEDGLFVSAFDHGGAGGGYENTWGTGKLYFGAMKVKNIRIHNRPAYNSEVHATRDMGVGELNNCYEDAELADTLFAVGTNALETQTNYFLNHWVPNLRGTSIAKKNAQLPGEPHEPARIVIVDPRRTVTANACETEAGKDRVLHLAINSGTDLALFNALLTYIADQGWTDSEFIAASTNDFDKARDANRTTLDEAAAITGLAPGDIVKAAEWIAKPKEGGARRRTMFAYEKGLIWGNDNYRTNAALVNLALATGNIGRPGGGCVRMGGHQEGYVRPDYPGPRPAPYIDQLLIGGQGGVHHIWACDHYKTTLNALSVQAPLQGAHRHGEGRHVERALRRSRRNGRGHHGRDQGRRAVLGRRRHHPDQDRRGEPRLAAGGDLGGDEPHLDERRAAHAADRALHGPARAGDARLPDRGTPRQQSGARVPRAGQGRPTPTSSKASTGRRRKTPSWTATTPTPTAGSSSPTSGSAPWGQTASRSRRPRFENGKIVGTKRLYTDGKFGGKDGKATFFEAQWRGLQAEGKQAEKDRFAFLINNGRTNHVWQNAYLDQEEELVMDRWPYPFIQMHPADMDELGVKEGDLVEVYNNNGYTQAMVYPTPTAKPKETFMLFAYPTGVQGNVVSKGVNELIIPNYKQTWGNIRKIADAPEGVRHLTFKSQEYRV